MSSIINKLYNKNLISPPKHLIHSVQYEVMMGSIAYGCSNDSSDVDVYGFSIPSKEILFPHEYGHIQGFGKKPPNFGQFQNHHIKDGLKEYDFSIYSIIKYFQLCMDCSPNMIDSLFVPRRCILHTTAIGEMVREKRKLFLSKKAFHSFKGYSYSQLNKCTGKAVHKFVKTCKKFDIPFDITEDQIKSLKNNVNKLSLNEQQQFLRFYREMNKSGIKTKRMDGIIKHGFDLKFSYHTVRLLDEIEQILTLGDIDLTRNKEQLKAIRRGDWTLEQVVKYFETKESSLEAVYEKSILRYQPDEKAIKTLLIDCLEQYFGTIEGMISRVSNNKEILLKIKELTKNV